MSTPRINCVLCGSADLKETARIPGVPVYMGTTKNASAACTYEPLAYGTCQSCNLLQILTLVDPKTLYAVNHNTEVVGKKWSLHNELFAEFIQKNSKCVRVLEVGDPAAKIAHLADYLRWYIVEPRPLRPTPDLENLEFIEGWLGTVSLPQNIDTIVLSHVFEHLHDPAGALKILREALVDDGRLCLSIPNMWWILENQEMPPAGLHFEHTFYCDLEVAEQILRAAGFSIEATSFFNDHSILISAKKSLPANPAPVAKTTEKLLSTLSRYSQLVESLNSVLHTYSGTTYLYGAHFPAQLLISLGLDVNRISAILDNATSKIGQTLYGTNLKVESPKIVATIKDPTVIVQMGPYTDEISRQLKEFNSSTQVR